MLHNICKEQNMLYITILYTTIFFDKPKFGVVFGLQAHVVSKAQAPDSEFEQQTPVLGQQTPIPGQQTPVPRQQTPVVQQQWFWQLPAAQDQLQH